MEKRTKKDMYNESLYDMRTYINGETAIHPYYYFRNGYLHVRYTVDRCVELSNAESIKLKADMTACSWDKQNILATAWNFFTNYVGKTIILDGVAEMEKRIKHYAEVNNGQSH